MKLPSTRAPTSHYEVTLDGATAHKESGKVHVKFFLWPSIIISIMLSVIGTILLNIIL